MLQLQPLADSIISTRVNDDKLLYCFNNNDAMAIV